MQSLRMLLIVAVLASLAGCEQQARSVYVLEAPQSVTLAPSASASKVQQGDTVVLHVARHTSGKWRQIPLDELSPGQCWVYQPPPESEPEVADDVHWQVVPENAVRFNADYRMDHTKIATMRVKGTIKLTPFSAVQCEPDRGVAGPSIEIEVY